MKNINFWAILSACFFLVILEVRSQFNLRHLYHTRCQALSAMIACTNAAERVTRKHAPSLRNISLHTVELCKGGSLGETNVFILTNCDVTNSKELTIPQGETTVKFKENL